MHKRHYEVNKALISLKHKEYKKNNPDKVRQFRRNEKRNKNYSARKLVKESIQRDNLSARYVKSLIRKKHDVLSSEIPTAMVEAERAIQLLKRATKAILINQRSTKENE